MIYNNIESTLKPRQTDANHNHKPKTEPKTQTETLRSNNQKNSSTLRLTVDQPTKNADNKAQKISFSPSLRRALPFSLTDGMMLFSGSVSMVLLLTLSPQIPSGRRRLLMHVAKLQWAISQLSSVHLHQTPSPL